MENRWNSDQNETLIRNQRGIEICQQIEIECRNFRAQMKISFFNWSIILEFHPKTFYVYGLKVLCVCVSRISTHGWFGLFEFRFHCRVCKGKRERKWDENSIGHIIKRSRNMSFISVFCHACRIMVVTLKSISNSCSRYKFRLDFTHWILNVNGWLSSTGQNIVPSNERYLLFGKTILWNCYYSNIHVDGRSDRKMCCEIHKAGQKHTDSMGKHGKFQNFI